MPDTGALSPTDFASVKQRFADLGDRLTDAQLLELADTYHEILRWRRDLRCRFPGLSGGHVAPRSDENPSFAPQDSAPF